MIRVLVFDIHIANTITSEVASLEMVSCSLEVKFLSIPE